MKQGIDLIKKTRPKLIGLENTIIFNLLERAQFKHNPLIYDKQSSMVPDFEGSFFDFLLYHTEVAHAMAGRFKHAEEYPFNSDLPSSVVSRQHERIPIRDFKLRINPRIKSAYFELIQKICNNGDDKHYGSSATCDISCLQAISHRIHIGKEVAHAKYSQDPEEYRAMLNAGDIDGIMKKLTNMEVEEQILSRILRRTRDYQLEEAFQSMGSKGKPFRVTIDPEVVASFYRDVIIPLTKEVEIGYFLESE